MSDTEPTPDKRPPVPMGSSMEVAEHSAFSPYSPEDVETALLVMAFRGGSPTRAHEVLSQPDIGMKRVPSLDTLRAWKNELYPERYHEILRERGREIEEQSAGRAREIMVAAQEVQLRAIEQTDELLRNNNPRIDPSQVAHRMAIVHGVNTDKLMTLTGRPKDIVEHRDPNEILRTLGALTGLVVDGTAEEVPAPDDAENEPPKENACKPLHP